MLKSIRTGDQQRVDPAKQTPTQADRVANDMLNCLHPNIAAHGKVLWRI